MSGKRVTDEGRPPMGDPYRNRGRTLYFVDGQRQQWLSQEFDCRSRSDVQDALVEFKAGSRVALHLGNLADPELRVVLRILDAWKAFGEIWWAQGSLAILSPKDAPPPFPAPGGDGDPSGDRHPRYPVVPLGAGAVALPEPSDEPDA